VSLLPVLPVLPADRSEAAFHDAKTPLTKEQAVLEANRCLYCTHAPCVKACPTGIDIPQFIRKIASDNIKGSAQTIFSSNILGMSCARVCPVEVLCVGDCVYNDMGVKPIAIGQLQRYATDVAFQKDWHFFEAGEPTGKSVGVVGGGPAGLACAHELRRHGHTVTIYEKSDTLGGLNTTGVAPYKMKADRSLAEVNWVLGIGGIDIKLNTAVGTDVTLEALEKNHDAIFFGAGLGADTALEVAGKDLDGIHGAVAFIERMKRNKIDVNRSATVVVVGGGNTAIDAVREMRGLGFSNVTMLYRGHEAGMSGYEHEWRAAQMEGVVAAWGLAPTSFSARTGTSRVGSVECAVLDAHKKPTGKTRSVDADIVLLAIGQGKLGAMLQALPDIHIDGGKVTADADGRTGRRNWFVVGDAKNGGKEVVNAVADGRDAARAIDAQLRGAQ
jgi:dihydropyrimidine dehydrogenase (NAD+) subunit PreT